MNDSRTPNPPNLPEDVFHEIFLHLPVKTLTRFRCVSKEWNRTITSPTFANWHYYISSNKRRRDDHLFMHSSTPHGDVLIHYNVANTIIRSERCLKKIGHSRCSFSFLPWSINNKLCLPIQSNNFELLGNSSSTCRGLLCMLLADHPRVTNNTILVMNPFTRQFREVSWPECNLLGKQHVSWRYTQSSIFVGFGYDCITDDYKIVVNTSSRTACSTHVMSLKSNNAWRSIEDGNNSCTWGRRKSKPVTIDGVIYWITTMNKDFTQKVCYGICKFNVTDERVEILPCPPDKYLTSFVQLGQYKGSLCFFCYDLYSLYGHGEYYWGHVFKLSKDDNGVLAWINVMDIPLLPLLGTYAEKTICGFTNNGDLIIYSSQFSFLVYLVKENILVSFPLSDAFSSGSLNLDETFHMLPTETLFSPLM